MEVKNKMNQVQKKAESGVVTLDIQSNNSLGYKTDSERNVDLLKDGEGVAADDYYKTRGTGIDARDVFQELTVSKDQLNNKSVELSKKIEEGQLDLTGEGVNINKELPKAPKDLSINDAIDVNDVNAETVPEISEKDLAAAEAEMARELERLSNEQAVTSGSADKQEISMPDNEHLNRIDKVESSAVQENQEVAMPKENNLSKLDEFMDSTKNTERLTEEITAPEKVKGVFDNTEVNSQITAITEIKNGITDVKGLLMEKKKEIEEVGGKINVLGVGSGAATALEGELKEYEAKLEEGNSELQEQISKLQDLVQTSPDALIALRNDPVAVAIPEIAAFLGDVKNIDPTIETVTASEEEILPVDTAESIKIVDESTVEVIVSGSLLEAINNAVSVLTDGDSEEVKIASNMAFHNLMEVKIKQLEETKEFTHKEVYAKVSDLIKNSNKIRVSLEDGKGIVVDILKLKSETKIMPAINAPENLADSVADGYDEQMAA